MLTLLLRHYQQRATVADQNVQNVQIREGADVVGLTTEPPITFAPVV
jgi:hypothetical protein